MKKNYVLDTNVLLHDPHAILKFEDNDLIIPIYVLEEIDGFKRDATERGRNARTVARLLDGYRASGGSLAKGVQIGDGGTLRVHVPERRKVLSIALKPSSVTTPFCRRRSRCGMLAPIARRFSSPWM